MATKTLTWNTDTTYLNGEGLRLVAGLGDGRTAYIEDIWNNGQVMPLDYAPALLSIEDDDQSAVIYTVKTPGASFARQLASMIAGGDLEFTPNPDFGVDPKPELDPEACPGCGSMPGEGRTAGCNDPDGCGFNHAALLPALNPAIDDGCTCATCAPAELPCDSCEDDFQTWKSGYLA